MVHQLLHHRRVAVVPVRPGRNAAGLAQRFCYRRHPRCRWHFDRLGGIAARGFRREEEPQPLLDFRPVLANRDVLALMVGYAAAIWGCVGLRQWIVVFLTFCAGDQANVPAQAWIILVVGAVISFLGVPAGLIRNELSAAMTGC